MKPRLIVFNRFFAFASLIFLASLSYSYEGRREDLIIHTPPYGEYDSFVVDEYYGPYYNQTGTKLLLREQMGQFKLAHENPNIIFESIKGIELNLLIVVADVVSSTNSTVCKIGNFFASFINFNDGEIPECSSVKNTIAVEITQSGEITFDSKTGIANYKFPNVLLPNQLKNVLDKPNKSIRGNINLIYPTVKYSDANKWVPINEEDTNNVDLSKRLFQKDYAGKIYSLSRNFTVHIIPIVSGLNGSTLDYIGRNLKTQICPSLVSTENKNLLCRGEETPWDWNVDGDRWESDYKKFSTYKEGNPTWK
jgi:hypothetical protein